MVRVSQIFFKMFYVTEEMVVFSRFITPSIGNKFEIYYYYVEIGFFQSLYESHSVYP